MAKLEQVTSRIAGLPIDNDLELHKNHFPPHMRHVHLYDLNDVEEMFVVCCVEPLVSEVKSFHMFVKTPGHRKAVVGSSALRQILKLPLAVVVGLVPGLGSSLCLVGKRLDRR